MKQSPFTYALLLFFVLTNGVVRAQGQDPARSTSPSPEALAQSITQDDLYRHLSILASDEYQGRETGTEGQKLAAEYIAGYFQHLGLPPIGDEGSYYQQMRFTRDRWQEVVFVAGGDTLQHLKDFYAFPGANDPKTELTDFDDVVFLGYGIDDERYSDYKRRKVEGKAILIYAGEPIAEGVSLLTGTETPSDWSGNWRRKVLTAKENGAAAVFFIDEHFRENLRQARRYILNSRLRMEEPGATQNEGLPNFWVSTTTAAKLMGDRYDKVIKARDRIKEKGKSKAVALRTNIDLLAEKSRDGVTGENVLGYIEGTDPELKDEVVIVTAHYDHLGMRGEEVYNGADDNGSGTSVALEVCEALAKAKENGAGPRRSVLVMLVSGEEKGLLGSEYYVSHPVFPLEQTVVNVNVDMVGRVDEKHQDDPNYVYVIGADRLSSELHQINEAANAKYTQLELDYTYNAEDDPNRYYYRSDHYNFARNGIPAIFYFNGTHPDYHRTSDTVEKINFEKMVKIGKLVFHTTWELANRPERIKVDKPLDR